MMRILILGGTRFVGKHIAEAALAHGHDVSLFHRGEHGADLFPQAEHLFGDRGGDLAPLKGRTWDIAIDTSGYVPRIVRASAQLLTDAVDRYIFVSTLSVYRDWSKAGIDEHSPLIELDDPDVEEVTGDTYGGLKVLCERAVDQIVPGRAQILRPGILVGPDDPTDRFTYWPWRVAAGGPMLAPAPPQRPVQFTDARDLAQFAILSAQARTVGVFNVQGPAEPLSFEEMLRVCQAVSDVHDDIVWTPDDFLLEQGVQPWTQLPLWVPEEPDEAGINEVDASKAVRAGLRFRPLEDTVRDTLAWARSREPGYDWGERLTRDREREIIAAWTAASRA